MRSLSALPETVLSDSLSSREKKILSLVIEHWPISALDIAQHFEDDLSSRELKKRASTKYAYYLQKLVEKQLVLSKRVGNALVVWPVHAEKYRTIHEILSER
jgi:hypothetical protein